MSDGLELDLPPQGTGIRAARRAAHAAPAPRGPSRRFLTTFAVGLVVCTLAGVGLAVVGVQTLRDSRAGRTVTSADSSDPGFEGFVEPTPTLAVLDARDGELQSAALLALANDDAGGGVMLVPPSTLVGDGEFGTIGLSFAFGSSPDEVRGAVEIITGVAVQEVEVMDDARWAEVVAPVAPLAIDNPDVVEGFPTGPFQLAAADVGRWLSVRAEGESEMARLYRQGLFWEAWSAAIDASGRADAVPGELDSGLGRFVRGLAAGRRQITTVPVDEVVDDAGSTLFEVDRASLGRIITDLVPFPRGTAYSPRIRVRLLDGTGDADHVSRVAPDIVAADASVVVVGNADGFDYDTTQILYHQPGQEAAAQRLRDALGAGSVVEDVRPIDAFDVTIVLGSDL